MKVYDMHLTGAGASQTGRTQETQQTGRTGIGAAGAAGSGGAGDRVELSSTLGRLAHALSAYGSERSVRVQALAAQYQSGNYRPDAAATARGLVAEALATGVK